jgi:hypothetical protein
MLMAIAANIGALLQAIAGNTDRAFSVAVANDQCLNALLGGSVHETVSAHAARARLEGRRWGCLLCNWLLDKVQPNHCAMTRAAEQTQRVEEIKTLAD